jgi:hypothetical protein
MSFALEDFMLKPLPAMLNLESAAWNTLAGPAGDKLYVAFVDHENERYTLLRDENDTVLVYNQKEWSAFILGTVDGEFD